uniref:Secreted protein n=3 Tax=Parascaris univalens TaxID=6257 RepID=A0A914ZGK4_PARUN
MSKEAEEEVNPVPTEAIVDESSVVEDAVKAEIIAGEDTEQLSEMSDDNDNLTILSGSKYHFSRNLTSWYRRIAPLIRNKKVRVLAVLNFFLTLIVMLLFLTIILLFGIVVYVKRQAALAVPKHMPCLFEWGEWSECSSTCRRSTKNDPPMMRRHITRIFNATGGIYAPCPVGLKVGYIQHAPCNVQICPKKLSRFNWTECFYRIPHIGKRSGCYKVRRLEPIDQLITIDSTSLYKECKKKDCPEFMP